ncbi:MAG: DUF222 domain-containing protein, partial [Actinomycetota bacterium]
MVQSFERMSAELREIFRYVVPFDRAEAWRVDGARSMADWLCFRFSISVRLAREWVRAAHALEELPAIAQGFAEGLICWEKLRQLVLIAAPETDVELARRGTDWSVAEVELYVRQQRRIAREEADRAQSERGLWSSWDRETGMLHFWGRLYGAEGAVVQKALDRVSEQLFHHTAKLGVLTDYAHRNADAFVELASSHLGADPDADRATVMCHVDANVLRSMNGNGTLEYGVVVGADTVRRIACDGRTQMVYWGPNGRPVGVGRASRTVPPWLTRLLHRRDQGCRWPGCGATRGVQAHHVVHWADGGRTDADNLLLLCRFHHRLVHEGGWSAEIGPDGELSIRRPDGSHMRRHS